ncbi:MAG TPA: protein kinase [Bacteroidota bacterium]|nr:protein kinase [Bacteroidota bacterium]
MIGQTVSHYSILEKLGEGGMGVVYKARDTDLDRDVALKFLSPQLAASEADKARFMQEARAAAALDHPNICTIFGIEEFNPGSGQGSPSGPASQGAGGPQLFFAMSFVDGTTLREKIPTLSAKQAIDIAIQIADGLSAAHEKGVVHRDIKPENIMLRKDGIVQVMDFGLARLRESSSKINRLTMAGSTVGTAGYMSPEQVQGQDADHRSDIFSLGVVLYELLTGQLPFKGVHQTALAYEIVNVDPPPVSSIKSEIDPALDALVFECLAKEPSERFQSVAELSKELRRYKRESGRSRVSTVSRVQTGAVSTAVQAGTGGGNATVPADAASGTMSRGIGRERLAWAGALVITLAVVVYGLLSRTENVGSKGLSVRFTIPPPEQTVINQSAISPDGKTVVFTATGKGKTTLWTRPLKALEAQSLPGTENATFPFWSPDSRQIGFFADGKMKKIDLTGGLPVEICDAPNGLGGAWNARGDILFAPGTPGGLFRVSSGGGIARPVTRLDSSKNESSHRWPSFLPDGNRFLFTSLRVYDEDAITYFSSLDDTARPAVMTSDVNTVFAAPSHILFLTNRTLMAQGFDPGSGKVAGDPFPVTVDVGSVPLLGVGDFSYSAAGILTTGSGRSVNRQYAWFDRSGKNLGPACPPGNYFDIALSPSETQAAVQRSDIQTGNSDIWTIDLRRNLITRFTFDPAVEDDPIWSADGNYIYFSNARGGTYNIYRKIANGVGSAEMATRPGMPQRPRHASADGRYLLFEVTNPETHSDIWVLPSDTTVKPFPYFASEFDETFAQFSPDGRWIAYASNESGRSDVYVQSFPRAGGRWQVSVDGGSQPRWRGDGGELYYIAPDLKLMAVEIRPGASFDYGLAKPLFQTRIDSYTAPNRYGVVENGKKFLLNIPVDEQIASPITVNMHPFED